MKFSASCQFRQQCMHSILLVSDEELQSAPARFLVMHCLRRHTVPGRLELLQRPDVCIRSPHAGAPLLSLPALELCRSRLNCCHAPNLLRLMI